MLSVDERLKTLEDDLLVVPMRISVYHDLPFAIFLYDPAIEFDMRERAAKLATRLMNTGKAILNVSLAELLWQGVDETRGMDYIVESEKRFGFRRAQDTITSLLSSYRFRPLPDLLAARLEGLDPAKHIVFLTRAAAMAPAIYRMSKLLDEMHGRTMVPIVLFYPGDKESQADLRFMGIAGREGISGYSYRVKIY